MIKLFQKKGITLVETVIYAGLLAMLTVLVVRAALSMHETYVYVKTITDINTAASVSMERFSREIRDAESVNATSSVLGSNPGVLVLNVPDGSGDTDEVTFRVDSSGRITLQREGETAFAITPDQLDITNLVFRQITNTRSSGVKIELTISNTVKSTTIDRKYYNSIIMRGSY